MKMRVRLHAITGVHAGQVFDLLDARVSVGRLEDNHISLDDGSISHHHALLTRVGDDYQVKDLSSTNGTFVNGQRVSTPTSLHHGDKIRFGIVEMQYESDEFVLGAAAVTAPQAVAEEVKAEPARRRRGLWGSGWIVAIGSAAVLGLFMAFHFQWWPFSAGGPLRRFIGDGETMVLADPDFLATQQAESAKDYSILLQHAKALVAKFPDQSLPHYILGVAYGEMEFFEDAVASFQRAINLKPDYADAWDNLGWVYTRAGKYGEAVNAYKQGIRLKPADAKAWNSLGGAFTANGKYDEAIAAYHKAVELKPDYAEAHYNLGVVYGGQENNLEAIKSFREATKLNPNMIEAWYDLGVHFHKSGADDEALVFFQRAIKLKPDYADGWAGIVKSHLALGHKDEAIEAAAQVKRIDPAKADELAEELRHLAPPP